MIEFDPEKDAANIAKHGVSLELASRIVLDEAVLEIDDRRDYGEPRWIAYQEIDGRLYVFVFTDRDGTTRAISLRKANEREKRHIDEQRRSGSGS
jgi:uncharacterized DUF497 family protein